MSGYMIDNTDEGTHGSGRSQKSKYKDILFYSGLGVGAVVSTFGSALGVVLKAPGIKNSYYNSTAAAFNCCVDTLCQLPSIVSTIACNETIANFTQVVYQCLGNATEEIEEAICQQTQDISFYVDKYYVSLIPVLAIGVGSLGLATAGRLLGEYLDKKAETLGEHTKLLNDLSTDCSQ